MRATKRSKITIFLFVNIITILFLYLNVSAQILNGGFEQWSNGEPANWFSDNAPSQGIIPVTQTTNSYKGNYALKGEVVQIPGTSYGFLPMVFAGKKGTGFSINKRATHVTMNITYSPVSGDTLLIGVAALKDSTTVLGAGGFRTSQAISSYQKITIPIDYADSTSVPDHLFIVMMVIGSGSSTLSSTQFSMSGELSMICPELKMIYPHPGSYFTVDNIAADTTALSVSNSGGMTGSGGSCFGNGGSLGIGSPSGSGCSFVGIQRHFGRVLSGWKSGIAWCSDVLKKDTVNLYFSPDSGKTYQLLSQNNSDQFYKWDIPDTLAARKGVLKIVNVHDTSLTDKMYIKIKPLQLSKVDTNGNYVLFKPKNNGWGFVNNKLHAWPKKNWQGINYQAGTDPFNRKPYPNRKPFDTLKASTFPPWRLWIKTFPKRSSYLFLNRKHPIRRRMTVDMWASFANNKWKGSCYGFAVTSFLYFYHKTGLLKLYSGLPDSTKLVDIKTREYIQKMLASFWLYQDAKKLRRHQKKNINTNNVRSVLAELKKMFWKDNGYGRLISYRNKKSDKGHAVNPYELKKTNSPGKYKLMVYNNNYPRSSKRFFVLDSLKNTWTDSTGEKWGTQKKHFYLSPKMKNFLVQHPHFYKGLIRVPITSSLSFGQVAPVTIYNTSGANIEITNSTGDKITYINHNITNNITGAVPITPLTGKFYPPKGYMLPKGNYTLHLSHYNSSRVHAAVFTDSSEYSFSRENVDSSQSDIVTYSNGFKVYNPDTTTKNITIRTVKDDSLWEKSYALQNLKSSSGDSIRIQTDSKYDLIIHNPGSNKNYDLAYKNINSDNQIAFTHKSVQLSSNSSQLIEPVDSNEVKILIDNGNDGTYDDSVTVSNQLTAVKHQPKSTVPRSFKLSQNYPNPFNPTTTIRYQLPKDGLVKLKVYNILGQVVRTLVHKRQKAGSYEVTFDAHNLASGMYIYKISVGQFSKTRKMLLIK
ncbi:MAG TPA: T9SS type A sorting domain-containing protein [Balneolales bacterium]|nr:T9SS type A sorting domain-containing protein [Balneolales bacterium]